MQLTVRCGLSANYAVDIDVDDEGGSDTIRTFGELRKFIAEKSKLDLENMKIIKGKTLTGSDDTPLSSFGFKEGDKVLVMGKPLKNDPIFENLVKYETKNLEPMQKTHDEVKADLFELQKNFLTGAQRDEMIRKMDKRLKMFGETGVRHMEALDATQISTDDTSEQQALRNREKRKAMINGIELLLNLNDKYIRELDEYKKAVEEEKSKS